jgi:hypothetical protein
VGVTPVFSPLSPLAVPLLLKPRFAPAAEMTGALYTRTSVEGWLANGTRWERIVLLPVVPFSGYDPEYLERDRTPDVWQAHQEQLRRWVFGGDVPQP